MSKADDKLTFCFFQLAQLKQESKIIEFQITRPSLEQIYYRMLYQQNLLENKPGNISTTLNEE